MQKIPLNQVEFKKRVGKHRSTGSDVYHYKLTGGLHLMALSTGKVLGYGPHRQVARKISDQLEPDDLDWTELSKSDHVDDWVIEPIVERYLPLTLQLRKMQESGQNVDG